MRHGPQFELVADHRQDPILGRARGEAPFPHPFPCRAVGLPPPGVLRLPAEGGDVDLVERQQPRTALPQVLQSSGEYSFVPIRLILNLRLVYLASLFLRQVGGCAFMCWYERRHDAFLQTLLVDLRNACGLSRRRKRH